MTVLERAPHVMPNLADELATVLESKMKEKGIAMDMIAEITGLTSEEIQSL